MFSYQQQSNLSKFFLLCLITVSSFFCFSDSTQAGNPTKYVTVHDPYTRLQDGKTGGFSSTLQYFQGSNNFTPYFRVFVPPGASSINLRVVDGGNNVAVARYNQYPDGTPDPNDINVVWSDHYSLSTLENGDCYVRMSHSEVLQITSDGWSKGLSPDRGGWIYVKIGGGKVVSYFSIEWLVIIYPDNVTAYNYWWDNYGSNPDGSISWEKDVESVYQYHAKLKGDLDDDDDVDANDYSIFQINYKNTDPNNIANLDGRSPVDANDYAILQKNYTGSK